jgi:hypothetical protein
LGEFHEGTRRLAVAIGDPDWSGVLAHELGHVEQLIEKTFAKIGPAQDVFDKHIHGHPQPPRTLLRATRALQRMEMDAERHALRLIHEFNLPVDVLRYVKSANAYVLGFEWARRHGRWPNSAWPLCPAKLISERQFGRLTPELESAMGSKNPST